MPGTKCKRANAERSPEQPWTSPEETERILYAIPSLLVSLDAEGRIRRFNGAAESMLGARAAEVLGRSLVDCELTWDRSVVLSALRECLALQRPARRDAVSYVKPDSQAGLLGITITPLPSDAGGPAGALIQAADVTERRHLEAQLAQAQKLESIGQLASGIAHEVNTPIQFVGDNTQFLKETFDGLMRLLDRYDDLIPVARRFEAAAPFVSAIEETAEEIDLPYLRSEAPKAIDETLEGVNRVAGLVRAMREFSHPGTEDRTPVDINRAIENTVTVARNEWKYVADVTTELDPALPHAPCFGRELNQALLNMVVNAAQAIAGSHPSGGEPKGTITITTRRDSTHAEIRIADTGPGIPEFAQSRVFDPFYTTKEVGKGSGQGLAIAHSVIVRKHGGSLRFETEQGRGTTFIVRLPLEDKAAALEGAA